MALTCGRLQSGHMTHEKGLYVYADVHVQWCNGSGRSAGCEHTHMHRRVYIALVQQGLYSWYSRVYIALVQQLWYSRVYTAGTAGFI